MSFSIPANMLWLKRGMKLILPQESEKCTCQGNQGLKFEELGRIFRQWKKASSASNLEAKYHFPASIKDKWYILYKAIEIV